MTAVIADYRKFLQEKSLVVTSHGPNISDRDLHPVLFPFQRVLVAWAVRKGRAALFADTGMGKTAMQFEWARQLGQRTLVIAPLSVARQSVTEAKRLLNIDVHYTRTGKDLQQINITNYEMLDKFDPADFGAVVLDESSILKSLDGKTRRKLVEMFSATPYRLACTATPAPNDIAEIGNHAEFLGIMTQAEMLAAFFIHDDKGWRLKRHAKSAFFRWLASWGMSIRKPSDLGFDDTGYELPQLNIQPTFVSTSYVPEGQLFFTGLSGIQERSKVRKGTVSERVQAVADLVNADNDAWIVWCGLNSEADLAAAAIHGAVNVYGSMPSAAKQEAIEQFQAGKIRVLVTKPDIAGFGMNFQHCHKMAFVGLGDSFESYYQCIRRCYRFGQKYPVDVHIVLSDVEEGIYQNVLRKEGEARQMSEQLIQNVQEFERREVSAGTGATWSYETADATGDGWKLMLGDSTERLSEIADESVHLSVFSPPFQSLYTYTPTERDLGNSKDSEQFLRHFSFIAGELLRITHKGRHAAVHVQQVAAMLSRDGYIGLKDFRGDVIRLFEAVGWIYHGEVCIDKDPQAQAIRTKAKSLLFVQLHKDSSWSRPALADYILLFRKPGENAVPVKPDISNEEWIQWARPIWYGIQESDTLQYTSARGIEDERHVCPLQLGTIERCIRLWTNPGETVCDPFSGIGSTGHEAIRLGRRFVGVELKKEYYTWAARNLRTAENQKSAPDLFSLMQSEV